jgi:hypothetical protein
MQFIGNEIMFICYHLKTYFVQPWLIMQINAISNMHYLTLNLNFLLQT